MDITINIRASETLKNSLLEQAELYDTTLSNYSRNILINHIDDLNNLDSSYLDEEDENYIDDSIDDHEASFENPYEKSYEFTSLLVWLFCRQMHPQDNNPKNVLSSFKLKIEKVLSESSFSNELKLEFLKVLGDLNRFLLEPDYEGKKFEFPVHGNHLSFDYYKLMNEIWSLEIPVL